LSVNYKAEQYDRRHIRSIKSMLSSESDKDVGIKKIIDDLQGFLSENHDALVEEILLGKKDKSKLESVISDWLSENDTGEHGYLKDTLTKKLIDNIVGWGKLQPLIDDPKVTNIFTNENLEVLKRIGGEDFKTNIRFEDEEELEIYIKSVMIRTKQKIGRDICIQDAMDHIHNVRIVAGISGSAIKQEVVRKPFIALRTYRVEDFDREFFIQNGTFSREIADFIEKYLLDANVIIVGEPDAGKTTLIEYLWNLKNKVDPMRRVIRMEEEAELGFKAENSVSFFERKTSADDIRKKYDLAEFARTATRLAGKDVVIGEVRGGEAWWLTRLLDMGYKGAASVHGSSPQSAIDQLAFLMSLEASNVRMDMLVQRVCKTVDFIVHVSQKTIVSIAGEIDYDYEKLKPTMKHIFQLEVGEDGNFHYAYTPLSDEYEKSRKLRLALKAKKV
jgi:Flp pilus assembly CpaF family ATPase